jgi:hypothetical protein
MRLIPDGADRSPNVLWLLYLPAILFWFIAYDAIWARRLRKYPWERRVTRYRRPLELGNPKQSWWAW